MSAEVKDDNVDWHEVDDDTDSDDDSETSSDSDAEKSDGKDGEKVQEEIKSYSGYKDNNRNYKNNRSGYDRGRGNHYNKGNPDSNYEKFYKNDPDFFVKVMKREAPPHELCVKIQKDHNRSRAKDLSQKELEEILAGFGVEEPEIMFMNQGGFRIRIVIQSSEECVAIYSDLYDNLYKKLGHGFRPKVFYQKDVEVLEAIADEEAKLYYQKGEERTKERGK